jgi:hypothetical protein
MQRKIWRNHSKYVGQTRWRDICCFALLLPVAFPFVPLIFLVAKPPAAKAISLQEAFPISQIGVGLRGCMSEQLTKVLVYSLAAAVALYLFFKPRGPHRKQ